MVRPETGTASQRTRRSQGSILERRSLARDKKNAVRQQAWILFQDESGFSQQPSVRTSWTPRGKTPILRPRGNHWSRVSVSAALGFRWDGKAARLFARTKPDSYNAVSLIQFLKQLNRFAGRGQRVILIWDHLPAHRSRLMKQFLQDQHPWLDIEWLPGYSPDLNPTEGVWNNIKAREMANLCPDALNEATDSFRRGLRRLSHTARLPFSFLHQMAAISPGSQRLPGPSTDRWPSPATKVFPAPARRSQNASGECANPRFQSIPQNR